MAHKQFLGHPGHRSSRPGTRFLPAGCPDEIVYVPWVPHTAHKLLTPGHRSGDPPPHPVGRTPPPPGQSPEKFVYVYVPFPFLTVARSWGTLAREHESVREVCTTEHLILTSSQSMGNLQLADSCLEMLCAAQLWYGLWCVVAQP